MMFFAMYTSPYLRSPHSIAHAGTKPKRMKALASVRGVLHKPIPASTTQPATMREDLQHADTLIARGVTLDSWSRYQSWVAKFRTYVAANCPRAVRRCGLGAAAQLDQVVLAFLAFVASEQPGAKTRVDSAKRAINLLRALVGASPSENDKKVQLLTKAARARSMAPTNQSPALPMPFIIAIVTNWGRSKTWWKRQLALQLLCSFFALARGAGVTTCLRHGMFWVRVNGTIIRKGLPPRKTPPPQLRGFLLLLPWRKNRQFGPSWIPISDTTAVRLMHTHLLWLYGIDSKSSALFLPRVNARRHGLWIYNPNTAPGARMSTNSYRDLLRDALQECCGLNRVHAHLPGTHSPRIAAMEYLRARGVPEELRRQMGDWMSEQVALSYLQMAPSAQFDILDSIYKQ